MLYHFDIIILLTSSFFSLHFILHIHRRTFQSVHSFGHMTWLHMFDSVLVLVTWLKFTCLILYLFWSHDLTSHVWFSISFGHMTWLHMFDSLLALITWLEFTCLILYYLLYLQQHHFHNFLYRYCFYTLTLYLTPRWPSNNHLCWTPDKS